MSSAAGERVRRSNFVYGSTKAGLDGFYLGLGEALREFGVRVLVIRPGQVRTTTIEHWKPRRQGSAVHRRQGGRRRAGGHGIGQGQGTGMGAGSVQVRDDGVAARSAAHLPQAPHLRSPGSMMRGALAVLGQMAVAAAVAVIVAAVSLVAIARVEWPAYNSSNQLHALTTVGQFVCLAGLLAAGWLWRRGRRFAARAGALLFLSAFSVVTLAMPLGATKLYLFGISVDQQFRTEYLTRLTDTAALRDMTYFGLPPFYPAGWFWIGGRTRRADRHTGLGDVQAVGDHLDRRRDRARFRVVGEHDSVRVRADRHDGDGRRDAGVLLRRAVRRVITVLLPPVLVLAWSGLRGRIAVGRLGGGRRRRPVPRRRRVCSTRCCSATPRSPWRSWRWRWPSPAAAWNHCCGSR